MNGENAISRRTILQGTAGIAVASTAGCLTSIPGVEGGVASGGTNYASWLYEPGTVSDRDHYGFRSVMVDQLVEHEDEIEDLVEQYESQVEDRFSVLDLDIDDASQLVTIEGARIVTGSFDFEDVREELDDADYDDDEYEGYEIYIHPDEADGFALNGDTVLQTSAEDPEDVLEELIDTKRGETDRYVDESEACNRLVNELGQSTLVFGRTFEEADDPEPTSNPRFDEQVASGYSIDISGEESTVREILIFDDEDAVDLDDVEDWAEDQEGEEYTLYEDAEDISVSQSGRAVIVTSKHESDEIFG